MNTGPTDLYVRLFGAPEILAAGVPLPLHNQKARALLYYLAATGQPHSRDHLTAIFWAESPAAQARHSLRSCLYRLRQALSDGGVEQALAQTGELLELRLAAPAGSCDVLRFRALVAREAEDSLAEAVALVRGPLLQGFSLKDSPAFEEWAREEEAQLSRACTQALDRLARSAEARGALDEAAAYLERLVRLDPLNEDAQRRLMRLHALRGSAPRALDQYRQFEGVLRDELGVAPSAETRAVVQEALRPKFAPATPATLRSAALPFVGRGALLGRLLALAEEPVSGRGVTVLLQGQAGIGKSRLLEELIGRLAAQAPGWTVLQGACSPFDDLLSYGPFLEILQLAGLGDAAQLAPDWVTLPPEARGRIFWRVLQTLRTVASTGPLLLAIDDLQWADSSTLNLFGFLSMRLRDLPVFLVGTVQRAESIPALQRLLTLGRRRGGLHLLSVEPLTPGAVTALLQGLSLPPTQAGMLAEWLHERSGGSPFILAEVIAQLRAEGILVEMGRELNLDTARWLRWRATFSLPETTFDLVAWRLANLPPDERQLLEVLAVAGHPLEPELLRNQAGLKSEAMLAHIDDLSVRGLIVERPEGTLALGHNLMRETLLHRLSLLRRRAIHRSLAHGLEAAAAGAGGLAARQIAMHAVAGEDLDLARRHGLPVLDELARFYRGPEALNFVHQLNDLLGPSATLAERLRLSAVLGDLHQSLGQLEAAGQWRAQHLRHAVEAGDPLGVAAAHCALGELALVNYDFRAAVQAAEAGLAAGAASGDRAIAGRARRLLGAALAMDGADLAGAEMHLKQAAAALRDAGSAEDLCAVLFELGNVAAQRGELESALVFYNDAAAAAERGQVHYYLALAQNNIAYHSLLLGRIAPAQEAIAAGLKVSEAHDLLGALLYLLSTQGEAHLYLAEWAAAAEAFGRGLALAEELGSLERQAGCRAGLALAARGQADLPRAIELLNEARLLLAGQGYWHLRARLELWLAESLLDAGRIEGAEAPLDTALDTAQTHGRSLLNLQGQRVKARLAAARGEWAAAEALFGQALELARQTGTPLEVARTSAAWGMAALAHAPASREEPTRLGQARAAFRQAQAWGDLASLSPAT